MWIKESFIQNTSIWSNANGWSYDGNYCKKEIYSNKLVGPGMPYLIGYVVIDVNTLEVSTELNDFYNPIYTKKEFYVKSQIELSKWNYLITDVDPINKCIKKSIIKKNKQ